MINKKELKILLADSKQYLTQSNLDKKYHFRSSIQSDQRVKRDKRYLESNLSEILKSHYNINARIKLATCAKETLEMLNKEEFNLVLIDFDLKWKSENPGLTDSFYFKMLLPPDQKRRYKFLTTEKHSVLDRAMEEVFRFDHINSFFFVIIIELLMKYFLLRKY